MDPLTEPFAGLCRALRGVRAQVEALAQVHASLAAFNGAFGDFQSAMALHASCLQFPQPAPAKKVSLQLSGIPAPQAAGVSALQQRRSSRESAGSSGGGGLSLSTAKKSRKSAGGGRSTPTGASSSSSSSAVGSGFYHQQQQQQQGTKSGAKAVASGQQVKKPLTTKRRAPAAATKPESPAWKWDKRAWNFSVFVCAWGNGGGVTLTRCFGGDDAMVDIRDQIPRKYQSNAELKKLEIILLYIKNRQSGMCVRSIRRDLSYWRSSGCLTLMYLTAQHHR